MTTKTKAIMGVGLVAGLGAAILPLASYAAPLDTDTVTNNVVRVIVDGSITIIEIDNDALALELSGGDISAGNVATGTHEISIATSVPGGYTLSMQADNANLRREGTTLGVFDGTGDTTGGFAGIGGSITSEADPEEALNLAVLAGVPFASTPTATGLWGFKLDSGVNYVSVPTTATIIAATDNSAELTPTVVTFGAQGGTTTPAGTYGAYITYVAATNEQAP
ncbi:hypothetical protein FWG76_00700 [Candidatus Saccharibacteria bacterium]|nr:hypothetical protein [Candidatus Saccharibacteria bacterium]